MISVNTMRKGKFKKKLASIYLIEKEKEENETLVVLSTSPFDSSFEFERLF